MVKQTRRKNGPQNPRYTPKFPNFIAAWRIHRGFPKISDLARDPRAAVTRISLGRLEAGKQGYRQEVLENLAIVLECTPGDLLSVDPVTKGVIFEIYETIPDYKKPRALKLLRDLAPKRGQKR